MDVEKILSGLVRLGTVTAVDNDQRLARVKFQDQNLPSDWLPVLISLDVMHYYPYDDPQWTEFETEHKGSKEGDPDYAEHRHKVILKPYMPKVNDQVLTVFLPVDNADGFVLGGIQPWKG